MIYKEAYKYFTGEMVYTFTGDVWFSTDGDDDIKEIEKLEIDKVAYKIK